MAETNETQTNDENQVDDTQVPAKSELDTLKERADKVGLKYHHNIGVDKLREQLNAKLNSEPTSEETSGKLSRAQRATKLRKEATKLVRVRITCMNPNKSEWSGEFFCVSNSYIGTVKKFVPFGVEYHVPEILLTMIESRQFQQFYNEKIKGRNVRKGKLVKEFGVERLKPLTEQELKELARRQAMREGRDEE